MQTRQDGEHCWYAARPSYSYNTSYRGTVHSITCYISKASWKHLNVLRYLLGPVSKPGIEAEFRNGMLNNVHWKLCAFYSDIYDLLNLYKY